jgi:hypothetical protein
MVSDRHSGVGKTTMLAEKVSYYRQRTPNRSGGKTTTLAGMLNPSSELPLSGMIDPKGDKNPPLTLIDPKGASFEITQIEWEED